MFIFFLLGDHGVETDFAVGVSAGGEQAGQVVALILVAANAAVQLRFHIVAI